MAFIEARDYEAARRILMPAVSAHPDWARGRLLLAVTFQKEKRYELARPHFERAWELDPKDPGVASFYGWCLYYLGEPEKARAMFEAHIRQNPHYADSHFALGVIALETDDLAMARRELDTAIRFAQSRRNRDVESKALIRRADLFLRLEQVTDARRDLEEAVKLKPGAHGAYFKLSRVLERLGDSDGAARALEMHRKTREQVRPSTSQPMQGATDEGT